jgi:hypothetical protein
MEQQSTTGALTARDLQSDSAILDLFPTRGFQDFLVTLPEKPDFPFEIAHSLSPELPTGVRFEVLQSTYPVVLYHNPDDQWAVNYVVLRATSGGGQQVRIRLTVDDGNAEPLQEPVDLEFLESQYTVFPYTVAARGGSQYDGEFEAALDATGIRANDSSFLGPALRLSVNPGEDYDGDSPAGKNWKIVADSFAGLNHRKLLFANPLSGDVAEYAMALSRDEGATGNDKWYLIPHGGAAGLLNLGGINTDGGFGSASAYRINNAYFKGTVDSTLGFFERGRSTAMGEWQNVAFNASNFFAAGAMTWTVASGDQVTFKYTNLIGKTLGITFDLAVTSVGGVVGTDLQMTIPGGFLPAVQSVHPIVIRDNGVADSGWAVAQAGVSYLIIRKRDFSNWTASANNTYVEGTIFLEHQ